MTRTLRHRRPSTGAVLLPVLAVLLAPAAARSQTFSLEASPDCDPSLASLEAHVMGGGLLRGAPYAPAGDDWGRANTLHYSRPFVCMTTGEETVGSWLQTAWEDDHRDEPHPVAEHEGNEVLTRFGFGDLEVEIVQTLGCNVLHQCYSFTNTGEQEISVLALTQILEAAMRFVGDGTDDRAGTVEGPPRMLYAFDEDADPTRSRPHISLSPGPGSLHHETERSRLAG